MRYVGGRDLAALLDRVGRLDPERALRICAHVAAALDAAHAHDLVHRDVKPGNVLLAREDDEDYAYLCDFGLAKHGASVTSLTGARDIVGTVGYLSPEQIDGLPVDGRTDVYALGCLLFECLAGEPPFVRENELATILAHRSEPPPLVSDRRPELPEALDAVLARALAKDREGRYATCGELVRDGRRALAGGAVEAPPPATAAGPAVHTFVFADIRGYTGLHARARRRGRRAARAALRRDRRGARARARRDAAAAARRRGARDLRLGARRAAVRRRAPAPCRGGGAAARRRDRARRRRGGRSRPTTCTAAGSTGRRACAPVPARARSLRPTASRTSPAASTASATGCGGSSGSRASSSPSA